ncbi:MAG TPA: hypothetical protein VF681_14670 [Abditibacteriaceae bacterium]|jgi:hypothetical protein
MPKVFLPQVPSRIDIATRLWVPTVDIEPARKFGELVTLLPPEASRLRDSPDMLALLRERLEGAKESDFLCCIGDPGLIAFAAIAMSQQTRGMVRLLKWDRHAREYIVLRYL